MKKHVIILILALLLSGCSSKDEELASQDEFILVESDEDKVEDNLKENQKEEKSKENTEAEVKNIGYKMTEIKKLYEHKDINFNFEQRKLSDGKDTFTGQSDKNKGAAIIEILGNVEKDEAEAITLMVINSTDEDHNIFNLIYLLDVLTNYTDMGDDSTLFLTESIETITNNPDTVITREVDGKVVELSFEPILASITLTVKAK